MLGILRLRMRNYIWASQVLNKAVMRIWHDNVVPILHLGSSRSIFKLSTKAQIANSHVMTRTGCHRGTTELVEPHGCNSHTSWSICVMICAFVIVHIAQNSHLNEDSSILTS